MAKKSSSKQKPYSLESWHKITQQGSRKFSAVTQFSFGHTTVSYAETAHLIDLFASFLFQESKSNTKQIGIILPCSLEQHICSLGALSAGHNLILIDPQIDSRVLSDMQIKFDYLFSTEAVIARLESEDCITSKTKVVFTDFFDSLSWKGKLLNLSLKVIKDKLLFEKTSLHHCLNSIAKIKLPPSCSQTPSITLVSDQCTSSFDLEDLVNQHIQPLHLIPGDNGINLSTPTDLTSFQRQFITIPSTGATTHTLRDHSNQAQTISLLKESAISFLSATEDQYDSLIKKIKAEDLSNQSFKYLFSTCKVENSHLKNRWNVNTGCEII